MRSRLKINDIAALQASGTKAQMEDSDSTGPIWIGNGFVKGENATCAHLKPARFELDLRFLEHENEVPPEDKRHRGPPGIRYEGADGSFRQHWSYLDGKRLC